MKKTAIALSIIEVAVLLCGFLLELASYLTGYRKPSEVAGLSAIFAMAGLLLCLPQIFLVYRGKYTLGFTLALAVAIFTLLFLVWELSPSYVDVVSPSIGVRK